MKPTWFQMPNGVKVHHSWCIFNTNGEVPDILKPTYRWGGYPIPQLIYKRAYAAEKTANEAPMLAQSKRLLIADINPQNYFTNQKETEDKLKAIANFRDNWGVMTKRPGDSVQQIDTSLTDLDEVIMTQFQLTAADAGLTATKPLCIWHQILRRFRSLKKEAKASLKCLFFILGLVSKGLILIQLFCPLCLAFCICLHKSDKERMGA